MPRPFTPPRSRPRLQRGIAPLLLLLAGAAVDTSTTSYVTQQQIAKAHEQQMMQTPQPTVWLDSNGNPTTFTHQNK